MLDDWRREYLERRALSAGASPVVTYPSRSRLYDTRKTKKKKTVSQSYKLQPLRTTICLTGSPVITRYNWMFRHIFSSIQRDRFVRCPSQWFTENLNRFSKISLNIIVRLYYYFFPLSLSENSVRCALLNLIVFTSYRYTNGETVIIARLRAKNQLWKWGSCIWNDGMKVRIFFRVIALLRY